MWWFFDQQGVSVLCNRVREGCFLHHTFLNLGIIQVAEWFAGCSAQRPSSCFLLQCDVSHVTLACKSSQSDHRSFNFSGLNAISFAIACLTLAGVLGWVTWHRLQMADFRHVSITQRSVFAAAMRPCIQLMALLPCLLTGSGRLWRIRMFRCPNVRTGQGKADSLWAASWCGNLHRQHTRRLTYFKIQISVSGFFC